MKDNINIHPNSFSIDLSTVDINKKNKCIGFIMRGYSSIYWNNNKLETKTGLRFLKRKSCSGCYLCGFIDEYLLESPQLVIGLDSVEDGKLYQLVTVKHGIDDASIRVIQYD